MCIRDRGSCATLPAATNAPTSRGAHACGDTMCPYPRAITCRLFGKSCATAVPYAGGVTGSMPPDSSSTGLSLFTGSAKSAGMRPRGHTPHTASVCSASRRVASPASAACSPPGRMRGTSSAHVTEKCSAAFICSARLPDSAGLAANSGASSPAAASASISGSRLTVSGV